MSSNSQKSSDGDEKQLCIGCMAPNEPSADFCAKCGAPLTSYASTGPVEQIFAEGHVFRQAANKPQKLIVVMGVWIIFGAVGLGSLVFVWLERLNGFSVDMLIGTFAIVISLAMIWKTTRNYFAKKQPPRT